MNLENIKSEINPIYKDVIINVDNILGKNKLETDEVAGVAYAAAFATGNQKLMSLIEEAFQSTEIQPAKVAASLMAMTNIWYSYQDTAGGDMLTQQPQIRMMAYQQNGGTTKRRFEMYALSASVIGKCKPCIVSHSQGLEKEGVSVEDRKEIGRIASVINVLSKIVK